MGVWTAGHCVYDNSKRHGEPATNFAYYPDYCDGTGTEYLAASVHWTTQWEEGNFGYDYALATVGDKLPGTSFPVTVVPEASIERVSYTSYGYPAQEPFNGKYENTCTADPCGRDDSVSP